MADPQTANIGFYQPTRGTDVDTWDQPVNANTGGTDTLFAGVSAISLTNANVTLTTPPNAGSSWSGPYQSQSAVLRFTGTLTGNCTITIPRAGFFIVDNQCVVGAFFVALASAAPGNVICAPPGQPTHVFCDGVNVNYVNLGAVGSALDLHATAVLPPWMLNCTVKPYLVKDGSIYNVSDYPALGHFMGATFGGNGITTFGVPDERQRVRLPVDPSNSVNRTTSVIANVMNAVAGSQFLQSHAHGITDPGHIHSNTNTSNPLRTGVFNIGSGGPPTANSNNSGAVQNFTTDQSFTGITVNADGAGNSQNLQPSIMTFLPLIKT